MGVFEDIARVEREFPEAFAERAEGSGWAIRARRGADAAAVAEGGTLEAAWAAAAMRLCVHGVRDCVTCGTGIYSALPPAGKRAQ